MLMDPKKLAGLIREKKKKMMESDPDVVSSEPHGYMNAQDVEDNKQLGRIERTLDVPEKSNADNANIDMSAHDAETVGLTEDEMKRRRRLSAFMDMLDVA